MPDYNYRIFKGRDTWSVTYSTDLLRQGSRDSYSQGLALTYCKQSYLHIFSENQKC